MAAHIGSLGGALGMLSPRSGTSPTRFLSPPVLPDPMRMGQLPMGQLTGGGGGQHGAAGGMGMGDMGSDGGAGEFRGVSGGGVMDTDAMDPRYGGELNEADELMHCQAINSNSMPQGRMAGEHT